MSSTAFSTLLLDLAQAYAGADTHTILTTEVVPSRDAFFEADPEKVASAYLAYVAANPEAELTSVAAKLQAQNYAAPYDLFHDLKVACGAEIVKHPVGSEIYTEIDVFFRSCADLLLAETAALGLRVYRAKHPQEQKLAGRHDDDEDVDDPLEPFRDDFERISRDFVTPNGEFISYINKVHEPAVPAFHGAYGQEVEAKTVVQPLFSALTKKSVLDPRLTVVPDPWQLAKAVGCAGATLESGTIKAFNTISCKIPLPAQAPAQVLESFFHPNWYTIEAPKWLQYRQKTMKPALHSTLVRNFDADELRVVEKSSHVGALGPSIDLRRAVLSEDLKQRVWYNNIGRDRAEEIRSKRAPEEADLDDEDSEDDVDDLYTGADKKTADDSAGSTEPGASEDSDASAGTDLNPQPIKATNLAQFRPEAVATLAELKKDRALIRTARDLQKAVSLGLLRLNKLRQERFLHSSAPASPSVQETLLYQKVVRLLALLAGSAAASDKTLELQLSKKIPILLNDYQGVLPGPIPAKPLTAAKSSRLAGIKGPFKKKSRFQ